MDQLIQCDPFVNSVEPKTGASSEAELIRRAQEGDAEAFQDLYKVHSGRVYLLCLRMMKGNESEAEDLTQEAFMQVFRKISTFRAEAAFSTWIHRITANIVLMRLRKKTVAEMASLDEPKDTNQPTETLSNEIAAPDLRLAGLIDRMNLQRAVGQLSPGYRSVFLLHDVNGYEHNEIADLLGCTIGTSKSQLHKARVLLRQLLRTGRRNRNYRTRHRRVKGLRLSTGSSGSGAGQSQFPQIPRSAGIAPIPSF